jgi:hypothetical protein
MSDLVLLSLRRKLVQAESDGNDDYAKALKKRIREREKAAKEVASLEDSNMDELRKLAAEKDIEGRSSMSKDELIAALAEED